MLRSSLYYAFPQFGMALVQSAPALAISVAAGSSAVTGYNLLMRLFSPFQQGQHPPVGRFGRLTSRRTQTATIPGSGGPLAAPAPPSPSWRLASASAPGDRPDARLWIGHSAVTVAAGLAAVTALWCILQMAVQPFMFLLIGLGRLRPLAWVATPGLVASTLALFLATRAGSVKGVLEAGSAGLCLAILPLAFETARAVRPPGPAGTPREGRAVQA